MFQRDMNPLSVGTHRIKIQNDPTVLLIWCFCRWCVPKHNNLFSNHLIPSLPKRCYKHVHYTSDGLCKTKRTKLPLKITVFVLVYGWEYCSGYLQSELQDHIWGENICPDCLCTPMLYLPKKTTQLSQNASVNTLMELLICVLNLN